MASSIAFPGRLSLEEGSGGLRESDVQTRDGDDASCDCGCVSQQNGDVESDSRTLFGGRNRAGGETREIRVRSIASLIDATRLRSSSPDGISDLTLATSEL